MRYVDKLEREALTEWIPGIWPEAVAAQLDDLRKIMSQTQRTVRLAGDVMKTSTTGLGDVLKSAASDMGEHVANLTTVSNDSRGLFAALSAEVNASALALQSGSGEVRLSVDKLQEAHAEVTAAYGQLQTIIAAAQTESRDQSVASVAAIETQRDQFSSTTSNLLAKLDSLIGKFDDSMALLESHKRDATRQNEDFTVGMSRVIEAGYQGIARNLNDVATGLARTVSELEQSVQARSSSAADSTALEGAIRSWDAGAHDETES